VSLRLRLVYLKPLTDFSNGWLIICQDNEGLQMEKMQVVSPAGVSALKIVGANPRINDLNGKTVCEVWNGVFKGDVTFPIIRKLLKEKF
jgi:hypothetical protein